jgi:putative oxidoreductase
MSVTSIKITNVPRRAGAWILQGVVATAFFAAGAAKLAGAAFMVQLFDQIGVGQWFRYATGLVEIIGALALIYPGLASIGGLWLGGTMFFGVLTHLFVLHSNPVAAIVLGLLNALIVYLRRDELASLARTLLGGANSPTPKNLPTHTKRE